MTVTDKELTEFRALLRRVDSLAQDDLKALFAALNGVERKTLADALLDNVPQIVELYRSMAADIATAFYGDTQGLVFSAEEALAAAQANRERVESSIRWALFGATSGDPLSLVSGIVQKHVVDGARNYGLRGFVNAGEGWYRAANPEACEFCRLLATRSLTDAGSPYSSALAATAVGKGKSPRRGTQAYGASFHTNCMCVPVRAADFVPPDYYEGWTREYYRAVDRAGGTGSLKAIAAAMRSL